MNASVFLATVSAGLLAAFAFVTWSFVAPHAAAQIPGAASAAHLEVTPANPAPGQQVSVSAQVFSIDTTGAGIRWYVNGDEYTEFRGERAITLTTGEVGSDMAVRADVIIPGQGTLTLTTNISPALMDLIIEADTRTPSFYKGRALPIGDEPVTAIVIPYVAGDTNAGSLTYKWTLGTNVLFGGPILGKTRATFTMPKSRTTLQVEITDRNGVPVGSRAISLAPVKPELYFYEDNPLRGMNLRAVGDVLPLLGEETTVRAEPYFVASDIFSLDPSVTWTVGGQPTSNGSLNELTLRSSGGSGETSIGYSLTNRQSFLQAVRGAFTVVFD